MTIPLIARHSQSLFKSILDGEPAQLSAVQRKNYDFNAAVVHRIHELDAELSKAKSLYAEKIASTMADYTTTVSAAEHMATASKSAAAAQRQPLHGATVQSSLSRPHEYSMQPNLLNALRDASTYNEAYEEAIDPVGAIVPDKLMNIERPPYKRTGERRRYHKVFTLRTPRLQMFPR